MRHLWIWVFPLFFLQNFGSSIPTPMGVIGVEDFVIWPYLALVAVGFQSSKGIQLQRIALLMTLFLGWALIGVLTIPFRYQYIGDATLMFSLLKVSKIALFGLAGLLTCRALLDRKSQEKFEWALLVTGVLISWAFISAGGDEYALRDAYGSTNSKSVGLAMIFSYVFVRWLEKSNSQRWHAAATASLGVMGIGMMLSNGRGGWLALLASLAFVFFRRGMRRRFLVPLLLTVILLPIFYQTIPGFQAELDKTFFPENLPQVGYVGTRNLGNIDDGARFESWTSEGAKFIDAPLLGAGYFHRGEVSGLDPSGSHNYFLQTFLEVGVVGGVLIILVFATMWHQASTREAKTRSIDLPVKAVLVAAIVGGLGGEHFYGGTIAVLLLVLYAPVGALRDTTKVFRAIALQKETPKNAKAIYP